MHRMPHDGGHGAGEYSEQMFTESLPTPILLCIEVREAATKNRDFSLMTQRIQGTNAKTKDCRTPIISQEWNIICHRWLKMIHVVRKILPKWQETWALGPALTSLTHHVTFSKLLALVSSHLLKGVTPLRIVWEKLGQTESSSWKRCYRN